MSTGNYNHVTTRIYSDIALMTTDTEIAADVADVFNSLTGYSGKKSYRKLLVAPGTMREELIARIEREVEIHREQGGGYLAFKFNQLVDKKCMKALYRASQEGVRVDLQVRGICCLRPGLPGVSDNITVTSIVGRFLEHPRIYYFRNGGVPEVFMGSADMMTRNLDRRVEVLFPVEDPFLRKSVAETILFRHLEDTTQLRRMLPDGSYKRVRPEEGMIPRDSQSWMLKHRGIWNMREE
jgi:polyphosphate kinase